MIVTPPARARACGALRCSLRNNFMEAEESPLERRLRRMYQQQAPARGIIADWQQVRPGLPLWNTFEGQTLLLRAIKRQAGTGENAPCQRHRAALLRGVLVALKKKSGSTPCPSLMTAHYASRRAAESTNEIESEWSCQSFSLASDRFVRLRVRDCIGGPGTGTRVWDSELAMCAWLVAQPADQWAGRHVLALGAGCGLAGFVLPLHASIL